MNKGNTIVGILETISTALSLTWLFVRTIGVFLLGLYLIVFAYSEPFGKPYQEQMYLGMGIVTLMVGIVLIGIQYYIIRQTQSKLELHEKQLNKKTYNH